jgi:hypothetical protein
MSLTKKNTTRKRAKKARSATVAKTYHSESLFPEKIKKVKDMLANSDFRPS